MPHPTPHAESSTSHPKHYLHLPRGVRPMQRLMKISLRDARCTSTLFRVERREDSYRRAQPHTLQGVVGTKVTGARMLSCGTSVYRQADGVAWKTRTDWSRAQNETIFILYESQDAENFERMWPSIPHGTRSMSMKNYHQPGSFPPRQTCMLLTPGRISCAIHLNLFLGHSP